MLPYGYDPANYNGNIWWNENNPEIREIWGTQEEYDEHIKNGGNWYSYAKMKQLQRSSKESFNKEITNNNGKSR